MAMDKPYSAQMDTWVEGRLAALNVGGDWQPNMNAGLARLRKLQMNKKTISNRWVSLATAVAAVCFCLIALPSPKVLAHRCLECTIAAWQSLSPPAPIRANLKPEIERILAPDFALKDANDKDVKLSDLSGKVALVNFWATWCEGCQIEIPWFVEFENKFENRGLVVVGISMDDDGWKSVKPWLKEKKVNYSIVIGNEALGRQYGLKAMPLTALVDRNGRIADVHSGLVNRAATELKIRALLQEKAANAAN
jgi:peroxiredoxin